MADFVAQNLPYNEFCIKIAHFPPTVPSLISSLCVGCVGWRGIWQRENLLLKLRALCIHFERFQSYAFRPLR
ncbi:5-methyltetrahydropteroyltriglutamate--homocysteine methyltransferase [Trichinella pseudospiralis]